MKPEDLLDPENLPEELQWVSEHYRLQPNDPVFLLIAWHWRSAQGAESRLANISLEMQAALDARIKVLSASAESIGAINPLLKQVKEALDQKPLGIAQKLAVELAGPIAGAVAHTKALEKALGQIGHTVQAAQRRQTLAAFVIGVVFGGSLLAWLLPR